MSSPGPATAGEPHSRLRRWAGPLALAAGAAVLFPGLFAGETLFFRDLYLISIPARGFVADALRRGAFPLWDPLRHGGIPALGPQVGLFSPGFLPFLLFDAITALDVVVLLHVAGAAWAAWLLARRLGLSRAGATACGAIFAFSGYALSTVNVLQPLLGLPWIPVAALAFAAFLGGGSRRALAGAAAAAAVPLLAGSPEVALLLLAFLALLAAVPPAGSPPGPSAGEPTGASAVPSAGRRAAGLAVVVLLAAAVGGIQLVPSLEMVRESTRSRGGGFASFSTNSVHPARLPELVVPGLLGPVDRLDDAEYWGARLEDGGFPYTLSIYLGGLALALALAGAFLGTSPLRAPFRRLLLAAAAAAIVVSLGRFLPGFRPLWELAGPLVVFRYPVKILAFVLLPVGLLAGAGIDAVAFRGRRAPGWLVVALAALAGAGLLAWGLPVAGPAGARTAALVETSWFGAELRPDLVPMLRQAFLQAALFPALGAALLLAARRRGAGGLLAGALAAAVLADLVLAGQRLNPTAPRRLLSEPPLARAAAGLAGGARLFRDDDPVPFVVRAPSGDIAWLVRARIETLGDYTAAFYGLPVVFHVDYDRLAPSRVAALSVALRAAGWERRLPVLRAAGVGLVLAWTRIDSAGYSLALEIPAPGGRVLRGYVVEGGRPARFASRLRVAPDDAGAVRELLARPEGADEVILGQADAADGRTAGCAPAPVRLTQSRPESLRAEVDAPCAGWIVLAENWYPGWKARLDGRPVPILRADAAFRAVAVPAGRHVVEMEYRPASLAAGALLSLLGLAGLAGLVLPGARGGRPMG